jgi:hypothetical protein
MTTTSAVLRELDALRADLKSLGPPQQKKALSSNFRSRDEEEADSSVYHHQQVCVLF